MRQTHLMKGDRMAPLLRQAARVLEVTAGSYGLAVPARARQWASGGLLGVQQPLHGVHDALEGNGLVQHRDVEFREVADVGG